jgi:hypothetical protein
METAAQRQQWLDRAAARLVARPQLLEEMRAAVDQMYLAALTRLSEADAEMLRRQYRVVMVRCDFATEPEQLVELERFSIVCADARSEKPMKH